MKTIDYGYLCEDNAQTLFLTQILPYILTFLGKDLDFVFEEDQEFVAEYNTKKGAKEVRKQYIKAAKASQKYYNLDVFVVCLDSDLKKERVSYEIAEDLAKSLPETIREKVVFCIPEQAIEYWFLHLKRHKSKGNKIEAINRSDAKKIVYQGEKGNKKTDPVVLEIMNELENEDIDYLIQKSDSFKHFFSQIQKFIAYLEK